MSSTIQTSSYARYSNLVRTLSNTQRNIDDLSSQLTTGKKTVDLKGHSAETQKLLALRADLVKHNSYVKNIDTAQPRVAAYDVILDKLGKLASEWQGSNLMPFEPGPPSVSSPTNYRSDALKISVNAEKSQFTHNAQYTVTSVPSDNGINGSYDITITDGLGGTTTRSINLKTVPPDDGKAYNFKMNGGPGDGAVLSLNFDNLQAAGHSTFSVNWPQANDLATRTDAALRDIESYLNERVGDRYLFSGSRYSTAPVTDLLQERQTTRVTLNGSMVNPDDYFEIKVGDKTVSYQVQPTDPLTVSFVAHTLSTLLNAEDIKPAMSISANKGILTLTGNQPTDSFDVAARVVNASTVDNTMGVVDTTQDASITTPQVDEFTIYGNPVDIGDTYEFTVSVGDPDDPFNQKYYNENPDAPQDLEPYQSWTVKYTVTEKDYNAAAPDTVNTADRVADKLREKFADLYPTPPVTINAVGSGATIELTAPAPIAAEHPTMTRQFNTEAKVVNGTIENTISVKKLPPEMVPQIEIPYVNPPSLPFYDVDYLTMKNNPKAYDQTSLTVDDAFSLSYGVSSDDKAFQTLIQAFKLVRVAANNPGKYEEYSTIAREMMVRAQGELRSVHAKVSSDAATLEDKRSTHKDAMATVTEQVAKIEGIDENVVAVRLNASMNALEAAYAITAKKQQLSLLNYLA